MAAQKYLGVKNNLPYNSIPSLKMTNHKSHFIGLDICVCSWSWHEPAGRLCPTFLLSCCASQLGDHERVSDYWALSTHPWVYFRFMCSFKTLPIVSFKVDRFGSGGTVPSWNLEQMKNGGVSLWDMSRIVSKIWRMILFLPSLHSTTSAEISSLL